MVEVEGVEVASVYRCTPADLHRILFPETFSSTLGFSEATFSEGKLEKFQEIWADWRSLEAQGSRGLEFNMSSNWRPFVQTCPTVVVAPVAEFRIPETNEKFRPVPGVTGIQVPPGSTVTCHVSREYLLANKETNLIS